MFILFSSLKNLDKAVCILDRGSFFPKICMISNKDGPFREPKTASLKGMITLPAPKEFSDANFLISFSIKSLFQLSNVFKYS